VKPSFIFILADDLGYADLACYGGRGACSPNLDRLAVEGLRFTHGYANSPVCSPTRFALATGRWQYRLRGAADEPIASRARGSEVLGLPPEHPTLASLLRDAGYATALVGKWHLGFPPKFGPLKSGYQEFFGPLAGGVDYFSHCDSAGVHDLFEGEEEVHCRGYLTDLLSERAVSFVRRQKGKPFLLSLHYTAPHWPWEAREDEAESRRIGARIAHLDGGSVETYLAMIRQMDEGIGRVLAAVDDIGATRDTLVVFTSDNGGERFSDSWPLKGGKMDLLEGGIRVPYIARWPARLPAGRTTERLAITMDWVATFLNAAGVAPHPDYPMDGVDLLADESPRKLYWRMKFREQKALRSGRWKYLAIEGNEFLFDVVRDARERANMKAREPALFRNLKADYESWEAGMPPIPPDAKVSLVYGTAEMAQPSS
jgi:arylsulfatase A-like enzyme